jgi:hypothetical protein
MSVATFANSLQILCKFKILQRICKDGHSWPFVAICPCLTTQRLWKLALKLAKMMKITEQLNSACAQIVQAILFFTANSMSRDKGPTGGATVTFQQTVHARLFQVQLLLTRLTRQRPPDAFGCQCEWGRCQPKVYPLRFEKNQNSYFLLQSSQCPPDCKHGSNAEETSTW